MSPAANKYDWNDETIGRLRVLWDEGHSTAEIGRRMGVSKNAIVGKVHRLTLEARPSPIRRLAEADSPSTPPPASKRLPVPKLADMVPVEVSAPTVTEPKARPTPAPTPIDAPAVPASRITARRVNPCCWPIGHPGTSSFHFCEKAAPLGKPYCAEHAGVAYLARRRPEAASGAQAD